MTTLPNTLTATINHERSPVLLTEEEQLATWLTGTPDEAFNLIKTSEPDPTVVDDEAPTSAATPRSRMKTVNLELPDYVWTDLKIRAAHKQTSVRHIVMTALKGEGITIADIDMVEDGRRMRGSNKGD